MTTFQKLRCQLDRASALELALTLLNWDGEIHAPRGGTERTARATGILAAEYYAILTDAQVGRYLKELSTPSALETLSQEEAAIVRVLEKEQRRLEKIPVDEYQAYQELLAMSGAIWSEARKKGDFQAFVPVLEKIVAVQRRFADLWRSPGQSRYDALLDQYEEGFTTAVLDPFFEKVEKTATSLIAQIQRQQLNVSAWKNRRVSVPVQRELCRFLAEYIGFDFNRGVSGESAHPFTTQLHKDDVRWTNHYYEERVESALFSAIHEAGHGIYEQNIGNSIAQTPVGQGASMGMHESQSRFYENILGRSQAFWKPLWPEMQRRCPEAFAGLSVETFVQEVNRPCPGPIRTEADELTYCLHVLIRYQLEKLLIEDAISVSELPVLWNQMYLKTLGLKPKNDGEGVLQDMHWSGGMFGYFPSYAIGSAIAAQIYAWMKTQLDVNALLLSGQLLPIRTLLSEKIYCYGKTKTTDQLLRGLNGQGFCEDYFITYLTEKYSKLYQK